MSEALAIDLNSRFRTSREGAAPSHHPAAWRTPRPCASGDDPDGSEAGALAHIGGLLGMTRADIDRARELFDLLGDPGRRTVLERLSRQPERPGRALPDMTGMDPTDIYHRLRCLSHRGFVTKNRHHIYSVDPAALVCASRYADLLSVAAALMTRDRPR